MKKTDFGPRIAPFDSYLTGKDLVGVEIGVDAGAHAEALLRYVSISKLFLIDPWPERYYQGICQGRVWALGHGHKVALVREPSLRAVGEFADGECDFLYFDQVQDQAGADLAAWWPKLKVGGYLGQRNYGTSQPSVVYAVDDFIRKMGRAVQAFEETGEMVMRRIA